MTSCGKEKCDPNCAARRILDAAAATAYDVFIKGRVDLCEDLDENHIDAIQAAREVLLLEPDIDKRVKALGGIIGFYTLCLEILEHVKEEYLANVNVKDCPISSKIN